MNRGGPTRSTEDCLGDLARMLALQDPARISSAMARVEAGASRYSTRRPARAAASGIARAHRATRVRPNPDSSGTAWHV
jgi:hypothetical protein